MRYKQIGIYKFPPTFLIRLAKFYVPLLNVLCLSCSICFYKIYYEFSILIEFLKRIVNMTNTSTELSKRLNEYGAVKND